MGTVSSTHNLLVNDSIESGAGFVFFLFCLWTFVVLSRPQDLLPAIGLIRPVLIMSIVIVTVVALRYRDLPRVSFFRERQIKYQLGLLMVMVLGIPFAMHVRVAFMEVFTGYINVVLFVLIFYKLVNSVQRLSVVILIGCIGSALYSAFALLEFSPGTGRLAFGTMFDPNDLGYFVLGFLPLNLVFISRENSLWIRLACCISLVLGMLMLLYTGSRGSMLAFAVAASLLIVSRTSTVRFAMKALIISLFLILLSFSAIDTERYMTMLSIEDDYNIHSETGRITLWTIGIKAMLDNPLTGVGVGSYSRAVGMEREDSGAGIHRWQTAHNSPIQIGAETGIVGLVLFMLISFNVLRIFNMAKKNTSDEKLIKISEMGIIGFVGLFVAGLFLSQAYSIYWGFYVAISAVVSQFLVRVPKS